MKRTEQLARLGKRRVTVEMSEELYDWLVAQAIACAAHTGVRTSFNETVVAYLRKAMAAHTQGNGRSIHA